MVIDVIETSKEVFGQFWAKARNRCRSAVANLCRRARRALALRDRSEENEADVEPANTLLVLKQW